MDVYSKVSDEPSKMNAHSIHIQRRTTANLHLHQILSITGKLLQRFFVVWLPCALASCTYWKPLFSILSFSLSKQRRQSMWKRPLVKRYIFRVMWATTLPTIRSYWCCGTVRIKYRRYTGEWWTVGVDLVWGWFFFPLYQENGICAGIQKLR